MSDTRLPLLRNPVVAERIERLLLRLICQSEMGDQVALHLLVRTCMPATRPIAFEMGPVDSLDGCARAMAGLLAAVAEGRVTPKEAATVARLLEAQARLLKAAGAERGAGAESSVRAASTVAVSPATAVPAPEKKQRNTMAAPRPAADPLETLLAELAPVSPVPGRRAALMTSAAGPVHRAA
jgi:hypothetical protein